MNIPNKLTIFRILLGPLFILAFFGKGPHYLWVSLAIALLIEITDFLDGYLARSRKQVTDFGKIFDPVADRISHYSIFLSFAFSGLASIWVIVLIFYRDSFVTAIRVLASARGNILAARMSGKIKMLVQGAAIMAILLMKIVKLYNYQSLRFSEIANWIMWGVAIVTVLSAFDYAYSNRKILKELISEQGKAR